MTRINDIGFLNWVAPRFLQQRFHLRLEQRVTDQARAAERYGGDPARPGCGAGATGDPASRAMADAEQGTEAPHLDRHGARRRIQPPDLDAPKTGGQGAAGTGGGRVAVSLRQSLVEFDAALAAFAPSRTSAQASAPAPEDDAPSGVPQSENSGANPSADAGDQTPGESGTSPLPPMGSSENEESNMADTPQVSTDPTADLGGSDANANQEALEGRFQALYVKLMEKQIDFKESVEPYKTDNQNAGKG